MNTKAAATETFIAAPVIDQSPAFCLSKKYPRVNDLAAGAVAVILWDIILHWVQGRFRAIRGNS